MKFLKNKKILITGGTGFIGSRLINELTKAECKIYLMVRQNNKLVKVCALISGTSPDKTIISPLKSERILSHCFTACPVPNCSF